MSWKSSGVLVATLTFCTSLMAQDKQSEPFLGIWEINLAKTTNYPQQSQMIINVPAPGVGFISTRATIGKDNKSSSTEIHPVAFDGKPHPTTGGDARGISYKLIDPNTARTVFTSGCSRQTDRASVFTRCSRRTS